MSSYMRAVIYLQTTEEEPQSKGYLRLERKGGYLLFSLVLTEEYLQEDSSIYMVSGDSQQGKKICLGNTDGKKQREGKILLSQLPQWVQSVRVCGALVGSQERYLTGISKCNYELPFWWDEEATREEARKEEARAQKEPESEQVQAAEEQEETTEHRLFEDDEMVWCREIDPRGISNLDMEQWYLAANSFLLQGYYNYHHLIYAFDGQKTYLGVPGQYHRRELYMARRFGFPKFKTRRDKSLQAGDFGYWLREIKKEV